MIDFPASPTVGQVFTAAGVTWTYDGVKWGLTAAAGAPITIGDIPPSSPIIGALWYDSVGGQMYVWMNDGNSSQWVPTTNQMGGGYMPLQGVTNGTDAPPGQIGEIIWSVVAPSSVPLTTAVVATIASITLTPGDWDICGEATLNIGAGGASVASCAINSVAATLPGLGLATPRNGLTLTTAALSLQAILSLRTARISLSTSATYYLNGTLTFPSGSCAAGGVIWARRAR